MTYVITCFKGFNKNGSSVVSESESIASRTNVSPSIRHFGAVLEPGGVNWNSRYWISILLDCSPNLELRNPRCKRCCTEEF